MTNSKPRAKSSYVRTVIRVIVSKDGTSARWDFPADQLDRALRFRDHTAGAIQKVDEYTDRDICFPYSFATREFGSTGTTKFEAR